MIVKNEEKVLRRCLDSLAGLYEELVIVDTGSTDSTKEIAGRYTDKVYDLVWTGSFSDARNFAFDKCTCDYIYSVDADEILDAENREKFIKLKQVMIPEIEIVQMYYTNQLAGNTTYNFDEELRPKLFKRLRKFTWIDPLHESVRLDPLVYDSDIRIIHAPEGDHSGRDFKAFIKAIERDGLLSDHLFNMYARELFISGKNEDFDEAIPYFTKEAETREKPEDLVTALLVLVKGARLSGDSISLLKYSARLFGLASDRNFGVAVPSELCFELGEFFCANGDREEAIMWYLNARDESESVIKLACHTTLPNERLKELEK